MNHYTGVLGVPLVQRNGRTAAAALATQLEKLLVGDGMTPEAAKSWVGDNIRRRDGYFGNLMVFDVPKPPGLRR